MTSLYLRLFWEYFKTGLFAVGGGPATIPFLQDISARTGWFTLQELADMLAVSESTPGPIGVNMATYIGFKLGGIPGSLVATIGLVTPSVIIILIVAGFLKAFRNNKYVEHVFYGIRPASAALIASAAVNVALICLFKVDEFLGGGTFISMISIRPLILAVVLWILTNYVPKIKDLHPVIFIVISAVIGIVFGFAS